MALHEPLQVNNGTNRSTSSYGLALCISLVVLSLFRVYYVLHGPLDLSADEALYWDCTRRLELSYYSKGPLIVYLMYISTYLFGTSVFAIRVMAVILSFLSSVFLYKLVVDMYGTRCDMPISREINTPNNMPIGRAINTSIGCVSYFRDPRFIAFLSAMLLQIIPLFATYSIVFTIDSPFVFFWILSLYLLWKAIDVKDRVMPKGGIKPRGGIILWVALGVSVGLGFQAKYIMAFFYVCAFLLFLAKDNRKWLKNPKPYLSFVISLAVFSPVIIWNMEHGWVTLKHTGGHAHLADGLRVSLQSFGEFIGSQAGVVTPLLFVLIPVALFGLMRREKSLQSSFLFYFSIPVLAFFLLKSIQGKVQANWAMTGYLTGIVAFVRYYFFAGAGESPKIKGKHTGRLVYAAVIIALAVTVISHYPYVLELSPGVDPSAKLRGWKTLGDKVTSIYDELRTRGQVFIFSDKYQLTGLLAFYVKDHPITYSINLGRRMNEYDMWPGINDVFHTVGQNPAHPVRTFGIFVTDGDSALSPIVASAFDGCDKQLVNTTEHDKLLRQTTIFICYNFKELHDKRAETF
ncbi:MAG: glycosyltransferase family 39 protein [Nitrospirae bacterium]|nr:glycosyltransferase family 39 protein [Nitrospirota bacterium]